jgi:hypothetical protein
MPSITCERWKVTLARRRGKVTVAYRKCVTHELLPRFTANTVQARSGYRTSQYCTIRNLCNKHSCAHRKGEYIIEYCLWPSSVTAHASVPYLRTRCTGMWVGWHTYYFFRVSKLHIERQPYAIHPSKDAWRTSHSSRGKKSSLAIVAGLRHLGYASSRLTR